MDILLGRGRTILNVGFRNDPLIKAAEKAWRKKLSSGGGDRGSEKITDPNSF